MKKCLSIVFLIYISFVIISCNSDNPTQSSGTFPYAGNWGFIIMGSYIGGDTLNIKSDGSFSTDILVQDTNMIGIYFTFKISGSVGFDGNISKGKIYFDTTQVGTISGKFTGNSGSGSYLGNTGAGIWSANRQKIMNNL